jgi:spore germination protein KC
MKHLSAVISLLLTLTLLVSGCWGRIETEDLAIVGSMGLDALGTDQVLVSLEITDVAALATGMSQRQRTQPAAWVVREQAHTILQATHAVQRRVPKRIFMGQITSVVFGQRLARKGVSHYLDYFLRQNDLRRTMIVGTCETGTGLMQRAFMTALPSKALADILRLSRLVGMTSRVTLNEFVRRLYEPGIEPITTHGVGRSTEDLYVQHQGNAPPQQDPMQDKKLPLRSTEDKRGLCPPEELAANLLREAGTSANVRPITVAMGIAVYREDKLQGHLDGEEARGYLWLLGTPREAVLETLTSTENVEHIALKPINISSSFTPVINGNKVERIEARVKIRANIAEMFPEASLTPNKIREIELATSEAVKAETLHTLELVQKRYKSDIYGFGQSVYRKDPALWATLEDDWNLHHFPELPVAVTVTTHIDLATGLLHVPR